MPADSHPQKVPLPISVMPQGLGTQLPTDMRLWGPFWTHVIALPLLASAFQTIPTSPLCPCQVPLRLTLSAPTALIYQVPQGPLGLP